MKYTTFVQRPKDAHVHMIIIKFTFKDSCIVHIINISDNFMGFVQNQICNELKYNVIQS